MASSKYNVKQVALEDLGSAARVLRSSSASRQGQYHWTFIWGDNRGVTCSCEGFVHHGHCKHIDNVSTEHLASKVNSTVDVLADTDGLSDEEEFSSNVDPFEGLS